MADDNQQGGLGGLTGAGGMPDPDALSNMLGVRIVDESDIGVFVCLCAMCSWFRDAASVASAAFLRCSSMFFDDNGEVRLLKSCTARGGSLPSFVHLSRCGTG